MDHLAIQILAFVKANPGWAIFVIGLTAFGESFVPGARLVREWHGRTHTVTVTEDGFEYAGISYLSPLTSSHAGARHNHRNRQRQEPATTHRQEAYANDTANTGRLG
jgi:DUF2924 family protein